MCGTRRKNLSLVLCGVVVVVGGTSACRQESSDAPAGVTKTTAVGRATRRAYNGAPPVIPHDSFGMACVSCHTGTGTAIPNVGFAPPSPHDETPGMSAASNCKQCHVFRQTEELFVENRFVGMPQDLRRGSRLFNGAPPVIPHGILMRENCAACHSGPAARAELLCSHPERTNCRQCHVSAADVGSFVRHEP